MSAEPFGAFLGAFASMAPAIARLTTYRPRCGRAHGRIFRSEADAQSYDAGYVASDDRIQCPGPAGTPFALGWADAAADWDRISMHSNERHLQGDDSQGW